ncbi:MAG: acyltransferase [Gammaproteobacteria bacterium]|nr:acyltransferase [Gammaproteobacteria bacterium]
MMMLENKNSREKLLYLESLRGFAAIIVAIFHGQIFSTSPFYTIPLITHGALMVEFFFVLSGFVIAYNYYERIVKFGDVVSFQLKRFLRLYPLHFLTLMIFVVIEIVKYLFQVRTGIEANNPAFSENNFKSFIENIFLVQAFFSTKLTWNGPSWSISTEFYT